MTFQEKARSLFLWLLMKDQDPAVICAGDLSLIQWVLLGISAALFPLVLGILGFYILGSYGLLGFGLYYVGVLYGVAQWLHFATRRQ